MVLSVSNSRGFAMVTTLAAAAIIVIAVLGVGAASFYLSKALKKAEVTNIVVAVEANLVTAMNNKINFSDPAVNTRLRNGTLPSLSLTTSFGVINIPIFNAGAATSGAIGFVDRNFGSCTAFSDSCVLRYEVRLQRTAVPPNAFTYSYAYRVEANPALIEMSSLGNLASFDMPIDPANYRVEDAFTKCDATDVFMTGINRDTGEAFCATKPSAAPCGNGTLPKGLIFQPFTGQAKAGTLMLDCTSSTMRRFTCPTNYALYQFEPRYADPEYPTGTPGKCVFVTSQTASLPSNYPVNPTSPYMRTVSGTFCPPYYKPSGGGCTLHPDTNRNNSSSYGRGRCGVTKYKNCTRSTTTTSTVPNTAALNTYSTCMASPPPGGCGSAPPPTITTTTCSVTETSTTCNGVPNSPGGCATAGAWTSGTAYADNFYDTTPSAAPQVTYTGRDVSCTFVDTSPACAAPATDVNGNTWGRKNPKWYGGVQVSGLTCSYDTSGGFAETVDASL